MNGLGNFQCPTNTTCGNNDQYPGLDMSLDRIDSRANIFYGIINYDNLGTALLSVV